MDLFWRMCLEEAQTSRPANSIPKREARNRQVDPVAKMPGSHFQKLPKSREPSSLMAGEAGDLQCLRDPPESPVLSRLGLFPFHFGPNGSHLGNLPRNGEATESNLTPRPPCGGGGVSTGPS